MKPNYTLIILAAGYSSRMKSLKALLPIGGISALERLILAGKLAACSEILVVTGYSAASLKKVIDKEQVREVYNPDFADGMFSSIKKGVEAVSDLCDGFFILPVDYPLVTARLLEQLIDRHQKNPDSFIVPTFMGKKGHPPLFPINMKIPILESQQDGGLKTVTTRYEEQMIKMDSPFEGAVIDMDRPEDYNEIILTYEKKQKPSPETCLKILNKINTPREVIKHSRAVGELAYKIGEALNQKGFNLDSKLLLAAGLLHDLARAKKKHWLVGAEILKKYGWDKLALLTKDHMFYTSEKEPYDFSEQDILCLCDKLFKGSDWVDLSWRRENLLKRFSDKEAILAINKRFEKASLLKDYIENKIGISLKDLHNQKFEAGDQSKTYYLVRHGQPLQHREKIFLGQTDLPLSKEGINSAKAAGEKLLETDINSIEIYCSDLLRTRQTGEIILKILKEVNKEFDLIMVPAFREMNLGKWDGCFIREIKKEFPLAYEQRGKDLLSYKISGGENFYDLNYRVLKELFKILESKKELIIITHAGVIAVIKSFIKKSPLSETIKEKPAYGEIIKLESDTPLRWPGI